MARPLTEVQKPGLAVSLLEGLVDAVGTEKERKAAFAERAKQAGLPRTTAQELYDRFTNRYRAITDHLRKANTVDILKLVDHCIIEVMESLSHEDWGAVSARDKAVIGGILVDKRQLLSGEPTAIISVEDRRNLLELEKAWLAEARRRNQTVDITPGDYSVDMDGTPKDAAPKVRIVEMAPE